MAFEELLGLYMPLLKFVARKYCTERDERDDCLAEAVLGFLRAIRTYDVQRGGLDGYIATVASHRLIDMARRAAGSHVELSDTLDGWGSSLGDPAQAGVPDMIMRFLAYLLYLSSSCVVLVSEFFIRLDSSTISSDSLM
jgi:RNA polymerase sigma factor (sigma-70 family)